MINKRCLTCAIAMTFLSLLIIIPLVLYIGYNEAAESNWRVRIYHIAAVEENWDYLPVATALSAKREQYGDKSLSKEDDPLRLGHIYRKAVFREYTDGSYTKLQQRQRWLGILGPLLFGKVGDILEIHLQNNLSRPVSLHTHGVFYEKQNEGALYQDSTLDKSGKQVPPGDNYTYFWKIPASRGPSASDSECMIWAYHSHISGDKDIHTGLIGPLIVCKREYLPDENILQTFLNKFVLLFLTFDENQSWYLDDNIASSGSNLTAEEMEELKEDESFQESNMMHSINGYMYDTLPGLESCLGSSIMWFAMGMGNEADIHAVTFEGHSLVINEHRTDVIHLFPGMFVTGGMEATHEGRWPIKSEVGDHFLGGMEAAFTIKNCHDQVPLSANLVNNKTRSYYIAAEEHLWNYAPSGINLLNGVALDEDSEAAAFFENKPDRIGGTYKKVFYKEYTSETFEYRKNNTDTLGILGPTLRAEVGDLLQVTFLNKATHPYSWHSRPFVCLDCNPHGVKNQSHPVNPGNNETFQFLITDSLGPASADSDCIPWRYFSNVDSLKDAYSGLNGFLLICRPGSLTDDGKQKNVDKEFALLFGVMDENESHYIEENIELLIDNGTELNREDPEFVESNLMHSINGLMYGNLLGLDLCAQDTVSWLLMAIGHEVDLHVAHFWGNSFLHRGQYRDTIELLPASHEAITMVADALGIWRLQCQTNDHLKGGMETHYQVEACHESEKDFITSNRTVREYYLAIVEEEWDYAPENIHVVTGEALTENSDSKLFVTRDETHIGSRYKKALFREYTDSTFTVPKERTKEQEHLGFLGPAIKAEVGEMIRITLHNNGSNPYNIQPHGLLQTAIDTEEDVEPGMTKTYTWEVPSRSGPSATGFNCTNWIYYSTTDIVKDTNSGLVGPLVICKSGVLDGEGVRNDVDKEFSVLFTVLDENESWYLTQNIQEYCLKPKLVDPEGEDFKESNLKHSINGRLYGTLEGLVGKVGNKVAWYLMGLGNEIDLHTAHFHGLTTTEKDDAFQIEGNRKDVIQLSPGIFRTVEMTFDSVGNWMLHCHVDDHLTAGMMAMVSVQPQ